MATSSSNTNRPRLRPIEGAAKGSAAESSVDRALSDAPASGPDYREGVTVAEKYRLIRKLGEGGMGTVWIAHNEALDLPVAIKFIRAGEASDRQVSRLTQEARAAAKIGHPAILRVFDFGKTAAGDPFIVMELLHGEDLSAALDRRGSIAERRAVQILLPVLHALVAAHAKGIVHRDLKPDNIFLAETDAGRVQPKLVDFGVAKLSLRGFERLTQSGAVLGSPAYMSPEQARGKEVEPSSDIWAACVVLYEMVTGTLPFEGDNYNALLYSILHDEPSPTSTHAGGDPRLWRIIQRGIAKDPRARWGTMLELGRELAGWLFEQGIFIDIAGGSLQSMWLQRPDSGVDYLGSEPPPQTPGAIAQSFGSVTQSTPGLHHQRTISTEPGALLLAAAAASRRRNVAWAGLAVGTLVLGLVALFAFGGGAPAPGARGGSSIPHSGAGAPRDTVADDRVVRKAEGSGTDAPEVAPSAPGAGSAAAATSAAAAGAPRVTATAHTPPTAPARRLKNPFER